MVDKYTQFLDYNQFVQTYFVDQDLIEPIVFIGEDPIQGAQGSSAAEDLEPIQEQDGVIEESLSEQDSVALEQTADGETFIDIESLVPQEEEIGTDQDIITPIVESDSIGPSAGSNLIQGGIPDIGIGSSGPGYS